jgi:hypothetical protein
MVQSLEIEEMIKTPLGNYSLVSWEDVRGISLGQTTKGLLKMSFIVPSSLFTGWSGRRGEKNPEDLRLRMQSFPLKLLVYVLRERPSLVWETEKAFRTYSLRFWDRSTFSTKPLRRERRDRRRQPTPRNLISRR